MASTTEPTITPPEVAQNGHSSAPPPKLHGHAFYESLGSPKFVLAPMVDQSEFAWRLLSRSFMTPSSSKNLIAYTPMLHARMFGETTKFRDQHFQPVRAGLPNKPSPEQLAHMPPYLDGHPVLDRPLFVQFCANDPDELLHAAEYVAPFCDAVDLNLGCPQGIARKGKYGAFLQEDQDLIVRIINKLHRELSVPVTAKIRCLETKEKTLEYARKVLSAGASILTVHGRHRDQKGHKTGLADWSKIRYLRENLPRETVIFANGNILRRQDIERCLEETGADGVMSAEGNLYDPSIFSEAPEVGQEEREYWRGRDGKGGYRMDAVFRRYMDIIYKYVLEVPVPERKPLYLPSDPEPEGAEEKKDEDEGPPKKKQKGGKRERSSNPNLVAMQPHLFRLLRPLVSKHHHVRDALAKCRAGDIEAFEAVLQMVEEVVRIGIREYEQTDGKSIEADMRASEEPEQPAEEEMTEDKKKEFEEYKESLKMVRECARPWWVAQSYVRPLPYEALQKGSLTLSKKEMEAEKRRLEEVERRRLEEVKKAGDGVEKGSVVVEDGANGEGVPGVEEHAEKEKVGGKGEVVDVPKEGLVCG